jgi:hypothetical protein
LISRLEAKVGAFAAKADSAASAAASANESTTASAATAAAAASNGEVDMVSKKVRTSHQFASSSCAIVVCDRLGAPLACLRV